MQKEKSMWILGDSYSTFRGCNPAGFDWYYDGSGRCGITAASETWWSMTARTLHFSITENNSFSGTTICNTTYEGAYCPESSFIGRFDRAAPALAKDPPDIVMIFGGTNDCWAGSALGALQWSDWTDADLRLVLPAFCYLLCRVKTVLPAAQTVVLLNTDLGAALENGLIAAGNACGALVIRLRDIEKECGHPTLAGMRQISRQVCAQLAKA